MMRLYTLTYLPAEDFEIQVLVFNVIDLKISTRLLGIRTFNVGMYWKIHIFWPSCYKSESRSFLFLVSLSSQGY